uniref:Uncharacterized protein n=1 Tax=Anguilla anguilla TaxID=7936 RepID=A0A0E9VCA7_ANGAN
MCRLFKQLLVMHSNDEALLVTLIPLIESTASKLQRRNELFQPGRYTKHYVNVSKKMP